MRLFVSVLAVLAMATVASAAPSVWFVATPTGANAGVATQGVKGGNTALTIANPALDASWTIGVFLSADAGAGLTGYDIGLRGNDSNLSGSALVTTGVPDTGWATDFSAVGTSPYILHYAQSNTSGNFVNVGVQVASFTLTDTGDALVHDMSIDGGSTYEGFGWGWVVNGDFPDVYFGGTLINGGFDVWAPGVITIHELPEPATLVLLGFGLVGLLRRR